MAENKDSVLDVDKQSIRGRACPVCGGKIIPSLRAIYQSPADPAALFPLWQCERCGYEEISKVRAAPEKKPPAPKKDAVTAPKKDEA